MTRLATLLEQAAPRLAAIDEDRAAQRPAPGRWSKKEILGHLIDSAANNHQRFVRAQISTTPLEFPGYEQDAWVRVQAYQSEAWADLVKLWVGLNRHLLHIIEKMPAESLEHACSIGGRTPASLSTLVEDYATHLEHHVGQILS